MDAAELLIAVGELERQFQICLTVHDHRGLLFDGAGRPLLPERHYHRHLFCHTGRYENPGWEKNCMRECAFGAEQTSLQQLTPFVHHCWKGASEVVVPVAADRQLLLILYGGPFRAAANNDSPLPAEYALLPEGNAEVFGRLSRSLQILGSALLAFAGAQNTAPAAPGRKGEILNFIFDRAHSGATLSELAEFLRLSPSRTSHIVHYYFGMPFQKLMLNERMTRARNMLLSTDYPLKEIAGVLGFRNEYYFNRCFRQFFGMPPGEFKSKKRE